MPTPQKVTEPLIFFHAMVITIDTQVKYVCKIDKMIKKKRENQMEEEFLKKGESITFLKFVLIYLRLEGERFTYWDFSPENKAVNPFRL